MIFACAKCKSIMKDALIKFIMLKGIAAAGCCLLVVDLPHTLCPALHANCSLFSSSNLISGWFIQFGCISSSAQDDAMIEWERPNAPIVNVHTPKTYKCLIAHRMALLNFLIFTSLINLATAVTSAEMVFHLLWIVPSTISIASEYLHSEDINKPFSCIFNCLAWLLIRKSVSEIFA